MHAPPFGVRKWKYILTLQADFVPAFTLRWIVLAFEEDIMGILARTTVLFIRVLNFQIKQCASIDAVSPSWTTV